MQDSKSVTPQSKKTYLVEVTKIVDHSSVFREIFCKFAVGDNFHFLPGQFVMLHVPAKLNNSAEDQTQMLEAHIKPVQRAYSIASSAHDAYEIQLLLKAVPGGRATEYVWSLREGAKIQISGPFGKVQFVNFHKFTPPIEQVLFLCTGSGIAQHLSFLRSFVSSLGEIQSHLLFGLADESEMILQNELNILKAQIPNFDYSYVLCKSEPQWNGRCGYVQEHLKDFHIHDKSTLVYMCGNHYMIQDTRKMLIDAGMDSHRIIFESFGSK